VTILDALFGCWHKRMSFPLTSRRGQRRPEAALQTGTYVVCLDCGKEFAYDWQTMKIEHLRKRKEYVHAGVEAKAS
jgi:ribosomal protein L32